MIVKNKKLLIGVDPQTTLQTGATLKKHLEEQFPDHEVIVVAGLQYVKEVHS
jgi:hypothetical protein